MIRLTLILAGLLILGPRASSGCGVAPEGPGRGKHKGHQRLHLSHQVHSALETARTYYRIATSRGRLRILNKELDTLAATLLEWGKVHAITPVEKNLMARSFQEIVQFRAEVGGQVGAFFLNSGALLDAFDQLDELVLSLVRSEP